LDINIWRYDIPQGNNPPAPHRELIASKRGDNVPRFSPDNKRIAFISDRSGTAELWICDADGQNSTQLTFLGGSVPDLPSWSPDSQRITFHAAKDGQTELFMIGAQGGTPVQLTHSPCNEEAPYWSGDGNWIYFGSDGSGQFQVWRMSAYGGEPVQITRNGGSFPAISADGKHVFFLKGREWIKQLWKVPASGGEETLMLDSIETNNFAVADQGIYYMPWQSSGRQICFLDFSNQKTHLITQLLVDKGASFGFSVSSDQRSFLYTQIDRSLRDLMLVENFQ
jgi:Tol biopolymer transport system component